MSGRRETARKGRKNSELGAERPEGSNAFSVFILGGSHFIFGGLSFLVGRGSAALTEVLEGNRTFCAYSP